ncbi:myosin light chain 5 [Glossophaga mutica]
MASRKTKKKEGGALRAQRASSNVFSNFEQTQIQEFKEAFTLMDQNRDGFIDKEDLKDTYASLGKTNVKDDELDAMLKEASGPINFTMFLNMFGEKLSGEPSGLGQAVCIYLEIQAFLIQIRIFKSPEKPQDLAFWDHTCAPNISHTLAHSAPAPPPICLGPPLPWHVSSPGQDSEHRCPGQGLQGARCSGTGGPSELQHRVAGAQAARAGLESLWAGTDAEETILNAFKMLDPEGKGSINKDYIKRLLMSQADKMTAEEVDQMFQFATIDAAGNLDYKALSYVLTHGEEKEE